MAEIKLAKRIKYAADVYKELIERAGFPLDLASDFLNNIPDADAAPVVHARWVMMAGFPACSKCGCSPADWEAKPDNPEGYPPYFHSCGAKMDGGAEG